MVDTSSTGPIELIECVDDRGVSPFARWLLALDRSVSTRVLNATLRLSRGPSGSVKGLGNGVSELRIDFGPGYRVYFGWDGRAVILLLGGGTKNRQQDDIDAAKLLWREYKETNAKRGERW